MALLMLVSVDLSFAMMNIDIVPASKLPVATLVYNYGGPSSLDNY
ncbi:MAG TPA: hypothetical protein VMF50_15400 [Candidatus Binataceae bacterium]|nr:hypothetical protein [Candidatus Binataceae bacterium]